MPGPWECIDCSRSFQSSNALASHCNALRHVLAACTICDRSFKAETALQQHLRDKHYIEDSSTDDSDENEESYCQTCNRHFVDISSLNTHRRDSSRHNWCFECSREFSSEAALRNHMANNLSHASRDLQCVFCQNMFKSPSGIALHIESGCHKITRHQVTAAVHAMKVKPPISIEKRLHGSASGTKVVNMATELSFNGTNYNCCLCTKTFKTLVSLNAHLSSPAHDADEFKCPQCKTEYKLISGLIQHIESGACNLARLKEISTFYEDLSDVFMKRLKL